MSFKVLQTSTRVLGTGKEVEDRGRDYFPSVDFDPNCCQRVIGNYLQSPERQGWYCFAGSQTVLAKGHIKLACKAHIESAKEATTVMGSNSARSTRQGV